MRGRGLEHKLAVLNSTLFYVAPHAGAWIETFPVIDLTETDTVAPHAGAWIETLRQ